MNKELIFVIYWGIVNLIGFVIMGIDKRKAIKHMWRIPEKTLFLVAVLGGGLGGMLGMKVFRHKTKHMKFVIGFPSIFIIQSAIFIYFLVK